MTPPAVTSNNKGSFCQAGIVRGFRLVRSRQRHVLIYRPDLLSPCYIDWSVIYHVYNKLYAVCHMYLTWTLTLLCIHGMSYLQPIIITMNTCWSIDIRISYNINCRFLCHIIRQCNARLSLSFLGWLRSRFFTILAIVMNKQYQQNLWGLLLKIVFYTDWHDVYTAHTTFRVLPFLLARDPCSIWVVFEEKKADWELPSDILGNSTF